MFGSGKAAFSLDFHVTWEREGEEGEEREGEEGEGEEREGEDMVHGDGEKTKGGM